MPRASLVIICCWGRVYIHRCFVFCFSLFLLQIVFQKKATPNKTPQRVLLFVSIGFTSMEKHLTFSRKSLLHKKGSSYSLTILGLTRYDTWVIFTVFYCEFVGDKIIFVSHKLFDIFSPQVCDTKQQFFNIYISAAL